MFIQREKKKFFFAGFSVVCHLISLLQLLLVVVVVVELLRGVCFEIGIFFIRIVDELQMLRRRLLLLVLLLGLVKVVPLVITMLLWRLLLQHVAIGNKLMRLLVDLLDFFLPSSLFLLHVRALVAVVVTSLAGLICSFVRSFVRSFVSV